MRSNSQQFRFRERMERVREIIERVIAKGDLVPTNDELAYMLGVSSPSTIASIIRRLENEGAFKVRRYSADRVITLPDGRTSRRRFDYDNIHFRERAR